MIVICGTLAPISKEQQRQAADELNGLPNNSVIAEVIVPEFIRMRDEIRACQKPAT